MNFGETSPLQRKLRIGATLVALFAMLLIWMMLRPEPIVRGAVSRDDVGLILRIVRREIWRSAFPDPSWQTVKQSPRSLCRLVAEDIGEIDAVTQDTVQVQVRNSTTKYFYLLKKNQSGWHASRPSNQRFFFLAKAYEGPDSPAQPLFPQGPVFQDPRFLYSSRSATSPLTASEFSGSLSNRTRLSSAAIHR